MFRPIWIHINSQKHPKISLKLNDFEILVQNQVSDFNTIHLSRSVKIICNLTMLLAINWNAMVVVLNVSNHSFSCLSFAVASHFSC